jgi:hypothetical protein
MSPAPTAVVDQVTPWSLDPATDAEKIWRDPATTVTAAGLIATGAGKTVTLALAEAFASAADVAMTL